MSDTRAIRLNLNPRGKNDPANIKEVVLRPFHELTVEEYIRIAESGEQDEGGHPLITARNRMARLLGIETRWVSVMSWEEIEQLDGVIADWYAKNDDLKVRTAKVNETLADIAKDRGEPFTSEDVRKVMDQFTLFQDMLTIDGRTFRAPHHIEEPGSSKFGQWISLQDAMSREGAETEAYLRALAIMLIEDEGELWPAEDADAIAFMDARVKLFRQAPFVTIMGIAAFFFSRSKRFALLCASRMTRFRSLLPPAIEPTSRVIPDDSELTRSLGQALGTSPN